MSMLDENTDLTLPEEVLKRLETADTVALARMGLINERLQPMLPGLNEKLRTIRFYPQSKANRIRSLRNIASTMMSAVGEDSACRKGCSHCCHIGVALTQTEAAVIGKAIGRAPLQVKRSKALDTKDYGYHYPCTFLVEGACSIYEHRPLACRTHYNLDEDELLCRLIPGKLVALPLLNVMPLQMAYVEANAGDSLADIREFFPPQKAENT